MTDKQAQSKFTPKQIIDNVLHLLTTSESPDDFTQDRLVKLFGSPTSTKQDGSYVFDGNVSSQWWYSFSKSITPPQPFFLLLGILTIWTIRITTWRKFVPSV